MNLLNIRTWADARAFLHVALPGIAVILVSAGYLTDTDAGLWVALGLVLADAGLSTFNTASGFRQLLYPLLAAGGALLIRYGFTTDAAWALWTGLAPILFGGGVASANTDTSINATTSRELVDEAPGKHATRDR
jgi:hypothetical protein